MKKLILISALVCGMMQLGMAEDRNIPYEQVPTPASKFVSTHFKTAKVSYVTKDVDFASVEYDVYLDNGTKLEFSSTGNFVKADNKAGLPTSIIPVKIVNYVQKTYPNHQITEFKIKRNLQTIELSNELELDFDKQGNFLRIDD